MVHRPVLEYNMLLHRVLIILFISFFHFSVRSAKSRRIFEVSPSFIEKHVKADERLHVVSDIFPYQHTR